MLHGQWEWHCEAEMILRSSVIDICCQLGRSHSHDHGELYTYRLCVLSCRKQPSKHIGYSVSLNMSRITMNIFLRPSWKPLDLQYRNGVWIYSLPLEMQVLEYPGSKSQFRGFWLEHLLTSLLQSREKWIQLPWPSRLNSTIGRERTVIGLRLTSHFWSRYHHVFGWYPRPFLRGHCERISEERKWNHVSFAKQDIWFGEKEICSYIWLHGIPGCDTKEFISKWA